MATLPIQTAPSQEMNAGQVGLVNTPPGIEPMQDMTGKSLVAMGNAQQNLGANLIKIADRLQGDIDDTRTAERTNALAGKIDGLLNTYSTLSGVEAFNKRAQFESDIAKAVQETGGKFDNKVQEVLYQAKSSVLMRTAVTQIDRHSQQEFKKYELVESKSTVLNMATNMARSYETRNAKDANGAATGAYAGFEAAANDALVKYAMKEGIPAFSQDGKTPTEAYKKLQRDMIYQPVAVSVTQDMIKKGDFNSAYTYLEEQWKTGKIDERGYQALSDNVTVGKRGLEGTKIAEEIFEGKTTTKGVVFGLPIAGMEGKTSSTFGERTNPTTGKKEFHGGIDIPATKGTPIYAAADGVVKNAWDDKKYGGGNSVQLTHGDGRQTGYAHMENFIVKPGQEVKKGDIIGYVGNTGNARGYHLHFTMRDASGKRIDPSTVPINQPIGEGKIIVGPQTPEEKQAQINAIKDPLLKEVVQAKYNHMVGVANATEAQQKKKDWEDAQRIAFGGDGNQWNKLMTENPALWNRLDPDKQAALMNGRPRGDDPDTMLKLLKDPNLWKEENLSQYRHLISQPTYERFFAQGNGPKSAENVRAATFDNDMFEQELMNAQLDDLVNATSKSAKLEVISLRDKFKAAIDYEQTTTKAELKLERKREILQDIIGQKVAVSGTFYDTTKPLFRLSPEEIADAYVNVPVTTVTGKPVMKDGKPLLQKVMIAQISAEERKKIIPALNMAGRKPTEENIAEFFLRNKNKYQD